MEETSRIAIALYDINKSYGKKKVLSDVTMEIKQGEIFGILGPSGCGKSTTVRIMAGILKPDAGRIEVLGKKMPNFETMGRIGYMGQTAALYPVLSGYENLKFFGSMYGLKKKEIHSRIEEVTYLVGLTKDLGKMVSAYSGGMKQRLSLAITLLANPQVLILDEPTVGIDPVLRKSIWDTLFTMRANGVTIIITTHVMDEVAHCDRLVMMQEGQILITGTPKEVQRIAGCESIEEAFIYYNCQRKGNGI